MAGEPVSGRFADETVVVTGSTRGIGAAIAERFGAEGANVVVTGRSVEEGMTAVDRVAAASDEGAAEFVEADLRNPDEIAALFEATDEIFGGVDHLVNNAGVETYTGATEATMDDWAFVLETDFRAYWLCVKHAVHHMDEGTVTNVSSNHAFQTTPGIFPYNAVKAGINGMTRAMALDLGPDIRVNTVNPGWVAVERTTGDMDEDRRRELDSIHPVGRIGTPEDVAGVVSFLASADAAFVTGASIVADGGRTAVMQDDLLPDYRARRTE